MRQTDQLKAIGISPRFFHGLSNGLLKVPITPKNFWPRINLYIALISNIPQKFLDLVETSIFCEFSK